MKPTLTDSNNPPQDPKSTSSGSAMNLDDKWFERDTLISELKSLVDPSQEFVEKVKVLAAIRLGVMLEQDEMPAQSVILEDTQAMQELDKILAEHNAAHAKPDNSPPLP